MLLDNSQIVNNFLKDNIIVLKPEYIIQNNPIILNLSNLPPIINDL